MNRNCKVELQKYQVLSEYLDILENFPPNRSLSSELLHLRTLVTCCLDQGEADPESRLLLRRISDLGKSTFPRKR